MSTTLRKEPPAGRVFEPKLNLPERRHSLAHQPNSEPRRGSASSRKGSDPPSWLTSMNARNNSVSSNPEEHRRSSIADGMKGLFGRRKSHDEGKPQQKAVVTSKHSGSIKNILKADPRGARKMPSAKQKSQKKDPVLEGTKNIAHLTAAELEQRRPHSGNPVLHGEMPMLTRIVSGDERDEEEDKRSGSSWMKDHEPLGKVEESDERSKSHDAAMGDKVVEEKPRRKSLVDVKIRGADKPRSPRGGVWGRFHRNENGIWTH